jgi:hypothetical protein
MWIYFNMADETEAKDKTLDTLQVAMIQEWSKSTQLPAFNEQANSASNIMMSQLSQANAQWQNISRQTVLAPNQQ